MGHETVGAVVSAGPDATGLRPGGNYLVYPWIGCGNCPSCQAGQENHCMAPACLGVHRAGGYADHVLVPHSRYLIDIGDLDPAQIAPYACSGLTTYAALKKIGEQTYRQHPVVIFGAGGLGLMCLTLIKALGGAGAIVVDIDPAKRQAALEAGALAAIDGAAPDAAQQIIKAAGGKPAQAAIDLVGAPATTSLAFDFLTKGGKLIIVGLFGGGSTWPIALIPMKALSIIGSYVGNLAELKELMELVRAGRSRPCRCTATRWTRPTACWPRCGPARWWAARCSRRLERQRLPRPGERTWRRGASRIDRRRAERRRRMPYHRHRRLRPNDSSNPGPAMTDRQLTILAALNLMVAVGAGAFGAHGLKRIVSPELLAVWQTGVLYHLIHALGILAVALLGARYGSPLLSAAGLVMFAGIVLFPAACICSR